MTETKIMEMEQTETEKAISEQDEKNTGKLAKLDKEHVERYLREKAVHLADTSREYEKAVVNMIDQNKGWTETLVEKQIAPLIKEYKDKASEGLAFAAFYAVCTYYRRNKRSGRYNDYLTAYKDDFGKKYAYQFLDLMCKKMLNPDDWSVLDKAERLCAKEKMGNNPGVLHCYAEYVAEACENNPSRAEYYVKRHMEEAVRYLKLAINADENYAKFYVTQARLNNIMAIYGPENEREAYFTQAQTEINMAIAKEDNKEKQNQYELRGVILQSNYHAKTLSQGIQNQKEEFERMSREQNVKNLEFLSFFSAVIGLLIAGTQLTSGKDFAQAAQLLVVLTGCLITGFGVIGFVLHGWKRIFVNVVIVVIGVALVLVAMYYGGVHALGG